MKPVQVTAMALLSAMACVAPLRAADTPADLIREFRGQSESKKRAAPDLAADYEKAIADIVSRLDGKEGVVNAEAGQTLESICLHAGRPGAEDNRLAASNAVASAIKPQLTPAARAWMIRQLERIGRAESVEPLVKLMADPEQVVRQRAILALQNNPSPEAGTALRAALDNATDQRLALTNALGHRRDPQAVPAIRKLVSDRDPIIVSAAVSALAKIGTPEAADAILTSPRSDIPDSLHKTILDAWLLCANNMAKHPPAAKENPPKPIAIYNEVYASKLPIQFRIAAARGLILRQEGGRAIAALLSALQSDEPQLQSAAGRFAAEMKGTGVTQALVQQLPKLKPDAQATILLALGERGDTAARPAVLQAINSPEELIRLAALEALGHLGDVSSIPTLAQSAAGSKGREQSTAREALTRLRGADIDSAILAAAGQGTPATRSELIRALTSRRSTSALPSLVKWMKDDNESVRAEAIKSVGSLGGQEQLASLVAILLNPRADKDIADAESAISALMTRLPDPQSRAAPLLSSLDQSKASARLAFLRLLGRTGSPSALDALRAAYKQNPAPEKLEALRAMGEWPEATVADDLLSIAKTDPNETHKSLAIRGYVRAVGLVSGRSANENATALAKALELASTPPDRRTVLSALGNVNSLSALKLVEPHMADPAVKSEATAAALKIARAIASNHKDEAASLANKVLDSNPDENTRRQAESVLRAAELQRRR